VLAVYIFGGASIKNFALTMFIGFAAGTYSSVFLAAPLYAVFRKAA
jgi:preprotein translocase subunit SecF